MRVETCACGSGYDFLMRVCALERIKHKKCVTASNSIFYIEFYPWLQFKFNFVQVRFSKHTGVASASILSHNPEYYPNSIGIALCLQPKHESILAIDTSSSI